jgi:hypothetical protein
MKLLSLDKAEHHLLIADTSQLRVTTNMIQAFYKCLQEGGIVVSTHYVCCSV